MTDITELAMRDKFEAWWEREYKHLESSKYTDAVPHIKYGFWMAYQAGGAELVEALEKAQRYIEELREWNAGLAQESCERQQLISELEPISAAAEKLVRCKGRYHSEQNYRALAALFGVNTPDLPPLDSESSAVTVKLTDINEYLAEVHDKTLNQAFRLVAEGVRAGDVAAMRDAGIKVEAE
ncbi:TPA: hypothetical protein MAS80_000511 [Klebsiella pneumoniae]|nr:hypothetical protein [Klebsiella pneumoniae]